MNYTFRDLLEALQELTEEQLDMTAPDRVVLIKSYKIITTTTKEKL